MIFESALVQSTWNHSFEKKKYTYPLPYGLIHINFKKINNKPLNLRTEILKESFIFLDCLNFKQLIYPVDLAFEMTAYFYILTQSSKLICKVLTFVNETTDCALTLTISGLPYRIPMATASPMMNTAITIIYCKEKGHTHTRQGNYGRTSTKICDGFKPLIHNYMMTVFGHPCCY